jgi:hypothetical protein
MKTILLLILVLLFVWFVAWALGKANKDLHRLSKDLEAKRQAKVEDSLRQAQARIDNYDRIKAAKNSDDDRPVIDDPR